MVEKVIDDYRKVDVDINLLRVEVEKVGVKRVVFFIRMYVYLSLLLDWD